MSLRLKLPLGIFATCLSCCLLLSEASSISANAQDSSLQNREATEEESLAFLEQYPESHLLVRHSANHREAGLRPISEHYSILKSGAARSSAHRYSIAGTFSPQLDQGRPLINLPNATVPSPPPVDRLEPIESLTPGTGAGIIVAIVDSGLDLMHEDFRNPDGTTRVKWYFASGFSPSGNHPELEEAYGCNDEETPCRIYDAAEINAYLLGPGIPSDFPKDKNGHGTHVASLAAANGLASPSYIWVGTAPLADLIIAQVGSSDGTADPADVLIGTKFSLDRAKDADQPIVANLSLGSGFGARSAESSIGGVLAELAAEGPGRIIVVASGNLGGLYGPEEYPYPTPLGDHTQIDIPSGSSVDVPLVVDSEDPVISGNVSLWGTYSLGQALGIQLFENDVAVSPLVSLGRAYNHSLESGPDIRLSNARYSSDDEKDNENSISLQISGSWSIDSRYSLRFTGNGNAHLWISSSGNMLAVLPAATKATTVSIPAAHHELIAVGSVLDRNTWNYSGSTSPIEISNHGSLPAVPGTVSPYSGAGPSTDGYIRPDVLAPGAYVIGSMSRDATPATSPDSIFTSLADCPAGGGFCKVIDGNHGISSGTSMASPMVAGVAALLLAENPKLTQAEVQGILRASTVPPPGGSPSYEQIGAGLIDVEIAMAVLHQAEGAGEPDLTASRIIHSTSQVSPDSGFGVETLVILRDADNAPADAIQNWDVTLTGGTLIAPPVRLAAGTWSVRWQPTPAKEAASTIVIKDSNSDFAMSGTIQASPDPRMPLGIAQASGGCTIAPFKGAQPSQKLLWLSIAFLLLLVYRGKHAGR